MSAIPTPLAFLGRAWSISVQTNSGETLTISNATSESLRVTFTIDTYLLMAYWTATIVIYNMAQSTGNTIQGASGGSTNLWQFNQPLAAGNEVTVSAGYLNSGSGGAFNANNNAIYAGRILQAYWTRDNVVDWKLNLRCVIGLIENTVNFVSQPIASGSNDYNSLNKLCSEASLPIVIDAASQAILSKNTYSRGLSLYGRPVDLIKQITGQYQGQIFPWISDKGLQVRSFDPSKPLTQPAYAYAPVNVSGNPAPSGTSTGIIKYTLIGSPQQTQHGVMFKVLLDSTPKIGDVVQIAPGVLINMLPLSVGTLPPVPNSTGTYVVGGLRHVGDTRGSGSDWYTEITGLTQKFFADFLTASSPPPGSTN